MKHFKEKISNLIDIVNIVVKYLIKVKEKKIKTCNSSCSSKLNWSNIVFRDNIIRQMREKCSSENERKRLRDIGKKGGFGKKGYTDKGMIFYINPMV